MSRLIKIVLFALLALYSATLIGIDMQQDQEHVRGYFSDIVTQEDYPLPYDPLFGINTTFSVCLLTSTALLFAVCIGCGRQRGSSWKSTLFQLSQVLVFLYLAADDRLRLHEVIGGRFSVQDAFLLFGIGVAEGVMLLFAGDLMKQPAKLKVSLALVCVFFCMMVFVDAFLPSLMPGRLAMEDLSKLWAGVFLFVYGWQYGMDWIAGKAWCCPGKRAA